MFLIFFKQIEVFSKFSSRETHLFLHISATLLRQIKDTISSLQVLLVDPEVQQHPLVLGLPALPVETQAEMFEKLLLFLLSHVALSLLSQPPKVIYTEVEIKQLLSGCTSLSHFSFSPVPYDLVVLFCPCLQQHLGYLLDPVNNALQQHLAIQM